MFARLFLDILGVVALFGPNRCQKCGCYKTPEDPLTVHHIYPQRFWKSPLCVLLIRLCRKHHDELEKLIPRHPKLSNRHYRAIARAYIGHNFWIERRWLIPTPQFSTRMDFFGWWVCVYCDKDQSNKRERCCKCNLENTLVPVDPLEYRGENHRYWHQYLNMMQTREPRQAQDAPG